MTLAPWVETTATPEARATKAAREARDLARARETVADLRAALLRPPAEPYTHEVRTPAGRAFSIHKSEAAAEASAARISGTVHPWSPA